MIKLPWTSFGSPFSDFISFLKKMKFFSIILGLPTNEVSSLSLISKLPWTLLNIAGNFDRFSSFPTSLTEPFTLI